MANTKNKMWNTNKTKGTVFHCLQIVKTQSFDFIDFALKPVRVNLILFGCLFVLSTIIYLFAYNTYRVPDIKIRYFIEFLLDIYVICVLLSLFNGKFRKWITIIISAFAYILGEIELVCIHNYHTTINPQIMQLLLETNARESYEFLATYSCSFFNIRFLIIPLLAIAQILTTRFEQRISKIEFRFKRYLLSGSFLVCLLLLIKFTTFLYGQKKSQFTAYNSGSVGEIEAVVIKDTEHNDYNELMPQTLYRILYSLRVCYLMDLQVDKLYKVCSTINVEKRQGGCPHIVLIIGESYNKHHSNLFGYHINNTPNQMQYFHHGNLVKFNDVVTPWDITSFAFKCFMTTWGVGDKGEWCDYPLITAIMKKAGYKVSFFTNQFASNSNKGTVCDLSGGFFLNDNRLSALQYDVRNEQMEKYDGDMVDKSLSKYKWGGGKSEFTIFHLIGQHFDYSQRCPQNIKRITVDMLHRNDLSSEFQKIMCDYDNSILYNDIVISKIVDFYKNKDAVIIYMSDHSEGMFAPGINNNWGRSSFSEIDYANAYENFQIPMWIYASDTYITKHKKAFEAIQKASSLPYMTDLLPYLVMHLGGVRHDGYDDRKDILSPHYNLKRKRLLRKEIDYNKIIHLRKDERRIKE